MRTTTRFGWTFAITSLAWFVFALDRLAVTTALPVIRVDLDTDLAGAEWTVSAYTLTFAVLLLTGAALGDRFGRRRMFAVGVAVFTVGSAAAALAPTIETLVAARAVQGLGGAVFTPLALTILSAAAPPARRAAVRGAWGGVGGLGAALARWWAPARDRGTVLPRGEPGQFDIHTALAGLPENLWTPAYQARKPRAAEHGCRSNPATAPGSGEAAGLVDMTAWLPGTRLILRKERPHPGAQLRITDADGLRVTGFLTNTGHGGPGRRLPDLELRHRRHARVEDRILLLGCPTLSHDVARTG